MPERGGTTGTFITPYQVTLAAGPFRSTGQGSSWFGPLAPMPQSVPDEVRGRAFDFRSGQNLGNTPKGFEAISFGMLRALADGHDLLRLVIETRKDQIGRMRWAIKPKEGKGTANDPRIKAITAFLRKPDGVTPFSDWLRSVLEDLFVIDAPSIYLRRDRSGRLLALEQIDGATIKRVIDDWGRTPQPVIAGGAVTYTVAYQQILKGQPLDYSTRDLLYRPRNLRIHRVYGYGPVEQVITTVNIALRRQATILDYFTDGTVPDSLIGVPETWAPEQIKTFQIMWDALFEGNQAARRRAKFIPGGMKVTQTREPELKGEIDEWIARVICFAFNVSPQALIRMMNRATAQTAKDSAEEEGLAPIMDWVKGLFDDILTNEFGADDLEFAWQQDDAIDEKTQADIVSGLVAKGLMTPNEGRHKLGMDPDPNPAADKLMVMTATGFVLLEANTIEGKQAMQDAFPAPPPPQPGDMGNPIAGRADPPPAGNPSQGGRQSRTKPVAKAADASDSEDPEPLDTSEQETAIAEALTSALAEAGDDVARQVEEAAQKADGSTGDHWRTAIATIVTGLSFKALQAHGLALTIALRLREAAGLGVRTGASDAGENWDKSTVTAAEAEADTRAAALLGLRWTGDPASRTTEPDPLADKSIVDTLRADVGVAISKVPEGEDFARRAAEAVRGLHGWTEQHAATIAITEAVQAGNMGLLRAYEAASVALNKRWMIEAEACRVCEANAAEGAVKLTHVFSSGQMAPGAHPRCRCRIVCEAVTP